MMPFISGDAPTNYEQITAPGSSGGGGGDLATTGQRSRVEQLPNGSLAIWNAEGSDHGYYLCQSGNGIGELGKWIFLTVHGNYNLTLCQCLTWIGLLLQAG